GDAQTNAHLLKYDTAHARFPGSVRVEGEAMVVNDDRIRVLAERDPAKLPWKSLGVEVVLECTGLFTSKAKAGAHLQAGAAKVVISAPHNMIPTKTGAAAAVGLVLPHLKGKLDGFSIRVPTINVSIVDLSFVAKRPTSAEEVNKAVKHASETDLKGLLEYTSEPLVS